MKLYDVKNKRIIQLGARATKTFWDKKWSKDNSDILAKKVKLSKNDRFILNFIHKYLPHKKGRILEGGCGQADKLYCMENAGYDVIGIDFAEDTIHRVHNLFPYLKLLVADVTNLPFKSDSFQVYWSLGVIEHFWKGYEKCILEMKRVISKDGYLFISFPSISLLRKIKILLGFYKSCDVNENININDNFYQFILTETEVVNKLKNLGFILLEKRRYDGLKGLKDEVNLFKPILQKVYDSEHFTIRIIRFILNLIITPITGHISFCIFKKIKNGK